MATDPAAGPEAPPAVPDVTAGAELTAGLEKMVVRSRRVLFIVAATQGVILVLAVIAIGILSAALISARHQIAADEARTSAALCDSQFTIATAKLPPTPPPTRLGVQFVEASRKAFVVLGCHGHLGPPPADLVRLGAHYSIPIRY